MKQLKVKLTLLLNMCDLQIKTNKYDGNHTFDDYPFELSDFQKHSFEYLLKDTSTLQICGTLWKLFPSHLENIYYNFLVNMLFQMK